LHQKKRRRSSGIPPMNFNNPEDDEAFSSSPFCGDSDGEAEEVLDDENSNSNSDSGDDDGTMMSLDDGDTTSVSMASGSDASTGSSTRLEAALRQAAQQAGTQGIDFDENGDAEPVKEEEEVVASFAPWAKKAPLQELESLQDQENINPFSASFKKNVRVDNGAASDEEEMTMDITRAVGGIIPGSALEYEEEDDEMSMDVTKAFGGIISNGPSKMADARRKSMPLNRRQSKRRRSSAQESSLGDETMDLTMAVGGIQRGQDETVEPEDEDMTMEFTSAVGGLLPQPHVSIKEARRASMASTQKSNRKARRESIKSDADDETMDMDMTVAMGSIMPPILKANPTEQDLEDEETMGMEITRALGAILKNPESRSEAKKIMELETDLGSSPFRVDPTPASTSKLPAPTHTIASETGSPSLAGFRGKGLRRSAEARQSTTPKTRLSSGGTPVKKPTTPSKQLTPQPPRPTTPGKTPPSKNVVMRTSSPRRLFKGENKVAASTPESPASRKVATPNKLLQKDVTTGLATPSFILTPQARRNSGVGLDKVGLGSPRVAALLDRRGSIGAQARLFIPGSGNELSHHVVRFEDPRAMEEEIDKEREIEEDRENGRSILEREVEGEDQKDITLNLKEMIQSLTPKKKPLRGRKSLHVGAAKGILGKRPIELDDEDEDDDDNGGVKRLKNFHGSPVKNVRLPAPPSKAETTTGRMTRAARKSLEESSLTPSTTSPTKAKVTTPRNQSRFKNAEVDAKIEDIMPLSEKTPQDNPLIDEESFSDERIQLQDFLNMTNIRFMELTTTKRRHTIAPKGVNHSTDEDEKIVALEDCVAAGAAIVPMLELYQHVSPPHDEINQANMVQACKELKAYISEGRKTVREIEAETYDENPPLFREYISATPDIKSLMDNQLKNVKTHARLLSKGMWYDWRMTLLATLKDGLLKTAEGMIQDEEVLDRQQELLDAVVPHLIQQSSTLEREEQNLQAAADEIANCDQAELGDARQRLIIVDADLEAKKLVLSDLRMQLERRDAEIQAGNQKKQAWLEEIHEAEKIREECRGWSSSEISILKGTAP
jgi:kinetochore protein Spc7/SPC105